MRTSQIQPSTIRCGHNNSIRRNLHRILAILACLASVGIAAEPTSSRTFTSQAEADAHFEKMMNNLENSGVHQPLLDTRFIKGTSAKQAERIAEIRGSWDTSFENDKKVISFDERPPPPPNGQFKLAESKGGLLKHVDKTKNGKRGKKGQNSKKGSKKGNKKSNAKNGRKGGKKK